LVIRTAKLILPGRGLLARDSGGVCGRWGEKQTVLAIRLRQAPWSRGRARSGRDPAHRPQYARRFL